MKICTYDAQSGLCSGCGRTLAEIADWFCMREADRRAVMDVLPERLRRLGSAS